MFELAPDLSAAVIVAVPVIPLLQGAHSGTTMAPGLPAAAAARKELAAAGITDELDVVLGDAGYWNFQHMDKLAAAGIQVLIPPDAANRKDTRPGWHGGRYSWMRHLLATELGSQAGRPSGAHFSLGFDSSVRLGRN